MAPTIKERFAFDTQHLTMFCTQMQDVETHLESLLDIQLRDLDSRWNKVEKSYESLMLSSEDAELKSTVQGQYDQCVSAYYLTVSQIMNKLEQAKSNNNSRENSSNASQNVSDSFAYIKVPPCDTEVFSGSYEEWPSFRDMFTAVYLNHPKLTCAQKLFHLRRKTSGNAGAIVKRFELTDDNFDIAWQALKTRYENTRVLVDNQLRILFNIPIAQSEDNESLQEIQASVSDCLAMLKSLGISVDDWDPILIHLISTKLPQETLLQWEQSLKSSKELPTWNQMNEFLF